MTTKTEKKGSETMTTKTTTTTTNRKMIQRKNLESYLAAGIGNCRWYEQSNASATRFCAANGIDLNVSRGHITAIP